MMSDRCANYEINIEMCQCGSTECPNRGICCQCVQAHRAGGSLTACLRQARPAATLALHGSPAACLHREATLEVCTCTYEPCGNRGICCECIRNHWTEDGTGLPACFR
jgi:hypothetical protein